nr:MAG TPA: hypothetical protein [Caudoviricetes sp.]
MSAVGVQRVTPFGKVSPQGRWELPQKLPYLV